jgi:LytS/YehU family sensor histidine kinase
VGFLVGLTGGLHRYTLGGFTDLACAISTTCEGLLGGLVHWRLMRAGRVNDLFAPRVAFFTTFVAEIMQLTSSPTFALRVSGGGFPLLGDSCSRSTGFLLHRAT